ncbi:MAG: FmdE family protein [Candidatus Methanofastidiosia archaeon]|jgi:formylmethanofuran dehydrogenase subunit E
MHITDTMLKNASAFHGHTGPYLVLGLRMGLLAKHILDGTPFTMQAEIHTLKQTPYSCLIDGVQYASGCTLGKGNITVKEDGNTYGIFSTKDQTITITVKKEIKDLLKDMKEPLTPYVNTLLQKSDEELFKVVS